MCSLYPSRVLPPLFRSCRLICARSWQIVYSSLPRPLALSKYQSMTGEYMSSPLVGCHSVNGKIRPCDKVHEEHLSKWKRIMVYEKLENRKSFFRLFLIDQTTSWCRPIIGKSRKDRRSWCHWPERKNWEGKDVPRVPVVSLLPDNLSWSPSLAFQYKNVICTVDRWLHIISMPRCISIWPTTHENIIKGGKQERDMSW